jgi:cyclin-dependent kinase 12/13
MQDTSDICAGLNYVSREFGVRKVKRFKMLNQIGEGTYGKVFKAQDRVTGNIVALKKMLRHHEHEGFPRTETREIKILKSIQHRNMVNLLEVVTSLEDVDIDPYPDVVANAMMVQQQQGNSLGSQDTGLTDRTGNVYMVFEYIEYDLAGLLDSGIRFNLHQIKALIYQLLCILDYIHSNGFLHRDLKCSNILVTDSCILKLGDFGLARLLNQGGPEPGVLPLLTNKVITLWYRPLELLLGDVNYNSAVDMWSVGCIALELLIGSPPFPARNELEQIKFLFSLLGAPPPDSYLRSLAGYKSVAAEVDDKRPRLNEWLSKSVVGNSSADQTSIVLLRDLIQRFLEPDPRKRISAREALNSRWFSTDFKIDRDNPTRGITPISKSANFDGSVDHHEWAARKRRKAAAANAPP